MLALPQLLYCCLEINSKPTRVLTVLKQWQIAQMDWVPLHSVQTRPEVANINLLNTIGKTYVPE